MKELNVEVFKDKAANGAVIVDARPAEEFAGLFIKNSVSVPFDDAFVKNLEAAFDDEELIFVCAEKDAAPIGKALGSSELTTGGYLKGGFAAWEESNGAVDVLITIDAEEITLDYKFDEFYLIDLRSKQAYEEEHLEDAEQMDTAALSHTLADLDEQQTYYLYATTAAEAISAASVFKRHGFEKLRVVALGYEEIRQLELPFYKRKKSSSQGSSKESN